MKAIALVLVVGVVLVSAAQAKTPGASFTFGRTGGNIRPLATTITASGAVKIGGVRAQRTVSAAKRKSLLALARSQGFFKLKPLTACPSTLPDFATLYVTIHVAGKATTKRVHGGCSKPFDAVYMALAAAVGTH